MKSNKKHLKDSKAFLLIIISFTDLAKELHYIYCFSRHDLSLVCDCGEQAMAYWALPS